MLTNTIEITSPVSQQWLRAPVQLHQPQPMTPVAEKAPNVLGVSYDPVAEQQAEEKNKLEENKPESLDDSGANVDEDVQTLTKLPPPKRMSTKRASSMPPPEIHIPKIRFSAIATTLEKSSAFLDSVKEVNAELKRESERHLRESS